MKLNRFVSAKNARAVALALLAFIYPIIVLSAASLRYSETIHRVTTGQTFDESIFGSVAADSLAALGFLALFIGLSFRSALVAKMASAAIFALGIALYVASPDILPLAGIATFPSLVALLVASAINTKRSRAMQESAGSALPAQLHFGREDLQRVAGVFLAIIIILEVGALAKWVTHPFFPSEIYSENDLLWRFAELESALFHSLGLLSPYLVALIAFSFFYKWFMPDLSKRVANVWKGGQRKSDRQEIPTERLDSDTTIEKEGPRQGQKPLQKDSGQSISTGATGSMVATYAADVKTSTIARNAHWMILSAALVIAPLVMMYPHLPGVNPDSSGVSTDEQYYMNWMSQMRADSNALWMNTIEDAFTINRGDRPLTLLIILTISNLTGSPDLMVIRFLPVALAPMLVLSNYVLIRHVLKTKQDWRPKVYAAIGAIFAALSPQIVVGEYAGFLSNWIALIAGYFAFYLLIKGWQSSDRNQAIRSFGIMFAILVVMMLVHVYTWAHLLATILLFGGISYLFARKSVVDSKIKIILVLVVVGTAFSIDLVKSAFFSTPSAAESDSALSTNILPQDTGGRWDRLFFTMSSYVGGYLSNPVLLLLGVIWLVGARLSKSFDVILLSMFFILALPIATGSVEFQTRVLYNIPFHIPALLALYHVKFIDGTYFHRFLIIAIALSAAIYALRAMASLYLDLPDGYVLENQFLLP